MAWRRTGKPIPKDKDGNYLWHEGLNITFKDPEYRIHPLMGHQVRSRHTYVPEKEKEQPATGHRHQRVFLVPKEASPQYRDRGEVRYKEADFIGVLQREVTFDPSISERPIGEPDFSSDKFRGHRFDLEALKFTYGFDSKSNRWVLYSPIDHNRKRLSGRSRALILRTIGMSPKKIAMVESVSYNTVKSWLKDLSGYPLLSSSAHDWATGVDEYGHRRIFSKQSPPDVRHIKPSDSGSSDWDNKVDMIPDMQVGYRSKRRFIPPEAIPDPEYPPKLKGLSESEKGMLRKIKKPKRR